MLPLSAPSGCAAARPGMPITPSVSTNTNARNRSDMTPRVGRPSQGRRTLILTLRRRRVLLARRVPLGEFLLIFLFAEVDPTDPREAHLVDRPVAVTDPVLRIRVG